MIDFSLQPFPYGTLLLCARCRWLHKNCWWLIIMARGEHFTLVLPPSHTLRSFPLLASRWSVRSTWHACIPKRHPQKGREWKPLFARRTKSLYWRRYFLSTVSHYISSAAAGAGVEHWAQGGRFSRVLDGEIISLAARGMQTVNRESKQVDVNLLCCNQYSGLDRRRNNSMKCQHIQFKASFSRFCIAGCPNTFFLP